MEQRTDCNACKKKEFSLKHGNLCSLTHAKPDFDGVCPEFDPLPESERPKPLAEAYQEEQNVSGWLAFFLWVGLGLGAVISVASILSDMSGLGGAFAALGYVMAICCLVVAVSAIIAFYKKHPGAVALATTYIVMVVMDGVIGLLYSIEFGDDEFLLECLKSFGWAAIWFTYLRCSDQVKAIIPPETRKWGIVAKVSLLLYTIAVAAVVFFTVLIHRGDTKVLDFYGREELIEMGLEEVNSSGPEYMGDGLYLDCVVKEGTSIVYTYHFNNLYAEDYDEWDIIGFESSIKEESIENLADWRSDPFLVACFEEGYSITYRYLDANHQSFLEVNISKEDLE